MEIDTGTDAVSVSLLNPSSPPTENAMSKSITRLSAALFAASAILCAGTAQAANFGGKSSNTANVQVGESEALGGPHTCCKAGIAVKTMGIDQYVDFIGIAPFSTLHGTFDNVKVYELNAPSSAPGSHDGMGVFSFARTGTQDVWFGEWSEMGSADYSDRTVYYVGDRDTYTAGTGTAVKYAVKGINKFNGSNLMAGDFTANFSTKKLTGELTGDFKLNIGTADISTTGAISGSGATAKNLSGGTLASGGVVSGQFFGASAASLAGIAEFANSNYNTAFGGNKK